MRREVEAGQTELERQLGSPKLVWNGAEVPYTSSSLRRGELVDIGGLQVQIAFTVYCLKRNFPTDHVPPAAGRLITIQDTEYRIADVRDPAPRAHYEISVQDKDV